MSLSIVAAAAQSLADAGFTLELLAAQELDAAHHRRGQRVARVARGVAEPRRGRWRLWRRRFRPLRRRFASRTEGHLPFDGRFERKRHQNCGPSLPRMVIHSTLNQLNIIRY